MQHTWEGDATMDISKVSRRPSVDAFGEGIGGVSASINGVAPAFYDDQIPNRRKSPLTWKDFVVTSVDFERVDDTPQERFEHA